MQSRTEALALVQRVFAANTFENVDIGPINDFQNINCFVISIPKSATTALQRGLERIGHRVLHAHNNPTTYDAFANGDVLRSNGIGLETVMAARLAASPRPIHVFFGYREPVSWYLSLAGYFALPLDEALRGGFIENLTTRFPWTSYQIDETAAVVRAGTGIDFGRQPFDHVTGLNIYRAPGVNLVCYRFDRMEAVRDYICATIDARFELTSERVNADPVYCSYRDSFRLPASTVARVHENGWFQQFYTPDERVAIERNLTNRRCTIGGLTSMFPLIGNRHVAAGAGWLLYGPYATLEPGKYACHFDIEGNDDGVLDITCHSDGIVKTLAQHSLAYGHSIEFTVTSRNARLEFRLMVAGNRHISAKPEVTIDLLSG